MNAVPKSAPGMQDLICNPVKDQHKAPGICHGANEVVIITEKHIQPIMISGIGMAGMRRLVICILIRPQDAKKMEIITVTILVLAGLLIFAIAEYIWIKGQDETPSLKGEVVYRSQPQPIIINHTSTNLSLVPEPVIERAKKTLHIAYGHTSHGSQITDGMTGLSQFSGAPLTSSLYIWNSGDSGAALDLRDSVISGDLGNPDRRSWADRTRTYLDSHRDVNVVIWSWCGQVSTAKESQINTYLSLMNRLESEYPGVKFVYMTGHLDGTGVSGNLNIRNEQIRKYCRENNKILYDFADIESYDPDANYYLDKGADDGCNYNGGLNNWALDWQNSHRKGVDWYECSSAHSEPLNANQKAYAAWWLWARLIGWEGTDDSFSSPEKPQM